MYVCVCGDGGPCRGVWHDEVAVKQERETNELETENEKHKEGGVRRVTISTRCLRASTSPQLHPHMAERDRFQPPSCEDAKGGEQP